MKLKDIITEGLNLSSTEKAVIVSMAVAPTEEMGYAVLTGARNAVTSRKQLEMAGYIEVDDDTKTASLTQAGQNVLTSENLMDDSGELTDRGKELIARFRHDKDEWREIE